MKELVVWLIQIGEPLPIENRIRKMRTCIIADKLIEKRHRVIWWTSAFDHFKKSWIFTKDSNLIIGNGLEIIAIKGLGYKKNISFSRLIDHRIIARKFRNIALNTIKPDIIIASIPPHDLAYEAVMFAKKNNIPVLVDIRDPWPDMFLDHMNIIFQKLAKIALYKDFQMIEKTIKMADGLIAATKTFFSWGLNYAKREKTWRDKIFYLGYKKSKSLNNHLAQESFPHLMDILKKKFIIFFVGTISKSYHNPLILLKAAEKLAGFNNIHFVIAGEGELFNELKNKSRHHSNITLTGWLNQDEIEFLLRHSKVGACPSTKIIDLPTNKVFSYLSSGLPVVSSWHGEIKELIEKYKIGFYYAPNDIDSLINHIKRLFIDNELYKKMSENARKVFNKMFDADKIYEEYAEHIEKVAYEYKREIIKVERTSPRQAAGHSAEEFRKK